jgi:diguanylate cyclase (GGDEF)-like protein/PAS domain S-box-containing protein
MQRPKPPQWLTFGTYAWLYTVILAIIMGVTVLRYHLLIQAEAVELKTHATGELERIQSIALALLTQGQQVTPEQLNRVLLFQSSHPSLAIHSLSWHVDGHPVFETLRPEVESTAPAWFAQALTLAPPQAILALRQPDERNGELFIRLQTAPLVSRAWQNIVDQARLSALNIFIILGLLTLLVRTNALMLARLSNATNRLKQGRLNTRMAVRGTLEARAVARTFNDMAGQIQSLVASLRHTEQMQSEQLHFTRQLIDALPLPVFVRDPQGHCADGNPAWARLSGTSVSRLLEQPTPTDWTLTDDGMTFGEEQGHPQEVSVCGDDGLTRDMLLYQATFTQSNGMAAGTIGALVDVTERKRAEHALRAEKERAQVTLASIGDGVITTDRHGRIDTLNEAAQLMTGHTLQQAVGRKLTEVFRCFEEAVNLTTKRSGEKGGLTLRESPLHQAVQQILIHRSGEHYAIEYTAAPIRTTDEGDEGWVIVFRDVSETRKLREQLSWHAKHDGLTGLHNRAMLAEQLTHAIFNTQQNHCMLAVCILDLDHFQTINEHHGSRIGDRLLKEVALRLKAFVTPTDAVARLGGDEFGLLLGHQVDTAAVDQRLGALRSALSQPYAIDHLTLHLTVSIGVALFPQDHANPDTLLRHADQAMCQAKSSGRNQVHVFDVEQDQLIQTLHTQQTRIAQALEQNEFRLYYQPKVNLHSHHIVGMEALLRWQHPTQGVLGPQHVFPLIEDTDLIIDIGEWVLTQALQQLRQWNATGCRWTVSVNIAARHFHWHAFEDRLKSMLRECPDVSPSQLELEILESAALDDVQYMKHLMQRCQALGVRFALDDFGTGYSSLSYLKILPAETIKIDKSFVMNILDDPDDHTLITAIVALARAFGRQVIAEGVESAAHGQQLLALGCELGQGFGIARPTPAEQVLEWAQAHPTPQF